MEEGYPNIVRDRAADDRRALVLQEELFLIRFIKEQKGNNRGSEDGTVCNPIQQLHF